MTSDGEMFAYAIHRLSQTVSMSARCERDNTVHDWRLCPVTCLQECTKCKKWKTGAFNVANPDYCEAVAS